MTRKKNNEAEDEHQSKITYNVEDSDQHKRYTRLLKDYTSNTGYDIDELSSLSRIMGTKLAPNLGNIPSDVFDEVLNKIRQNRNSNTKIELEERITKLKRELLSAINDKDEYWRLYNELNEEKKSYHIINRIHSEAVSAYTNSQDFRNFFKHGNEVDAVVVSIDIRRSTELMLKARSSTDYSDFITTLSEGLSNIIKGNLGIFDKFTGDGILAFFPTFYSGEDAVLRALISAEQCHELFYEHYNSNRNKFTVFIKDIGLGVGIDFGKVSIVNTSSELTVVGAAVVYACRFSSAKAGHTLLNQGGLENLNDLGHKMVRYISETEILIKNEGLALAYEVEIDSALFLEEVEKPWEVYLDNDSDTSDRSIDNDINTADQSNGNSNE